MNARVLRLPGPRLGTLIGTLATVGLVAVVAWLGLVHWDLRVVHRADASAASAATAPAAAERAATRILSYDHRSLAVGAAAAERLMTPRFARSYATTMDRVVRRSALRQQATVTAAVRGSAVVAAGADTARVLLYVDQSTTSTATGGRPRLVPARVGMRLVRRHGVWLVDGITSY